MTRDSFSFRWHGWWVSSHRATPIDCASRAAADGLIPGNAIRYEVEPASLGGDHAIIAPHPCMRWDPVGSRTMMQLYASVAKLRSSGSPFFRPAWKPWGRTSYRYLGSFMADRRSKAPARQNLLLCFSSCRF